MADNKKHTNQNGYQMLNGPDDTLWISRSSNESWLYFSMHFQKKWLKSKKNIFRYHAVRMMCREQKSMHSL